ncbi:hypothetical protein VPH35_140192 [Triticum aestivum]
MLGQPRAVAASSGSSQLRCIWAMAGNARRADGWRESCWTAQARARPAVGWVEVDLPSMVSLAPIWFCRILALTIFFCQVIALSDIDLLDLAADEFRSSLSKIHMDWRMSPLDI